MNTINMTYGWLNWDLGNVAHGDLPPDVRARIAADRHRANALQVLVRTMTIPWVADRSLSRHIGNCRRACTAWRKWARLASNGHDVYLERFAADWVGPKRGFGDVRIYLDGTIVGRAWSLGCALGVSGHDGPAVAMLRGDLALRVDARSVNLEIIRAK